MNLAEFNINIIDPFKMCFDKGFYNKTFEEIIKTEINRQHEKSNTNAIGYFHQNMFKYIKNCEVPKEGWDVIYTGKDHKIYVEMKNKHNTMNSSSAQKTYIGMANQIMKTKKDYCYLVEVIATKSQNIAWGASVNGKHVENERIRRVSIDEFYREVTGVKDAFFQICVQLPITIEKIVNESDFNISSSNIVIKEIKKINPNILAAFYKLAFETYLGFDKMFDK
ncbi:MAG: Eco47II family restriction endonuclease [Lachnospiraceae bacterium]|nr:Eco47II family restriction endonuclease [Lachnospiraceae bacterium]